MRSYYFCKEGLEGTNNGLQCIYVIGQIWVVDFDFELILILVGGPCTVSNGWLTRQPCVQTCY